MKGYKSDEGFYRKSKRRVTSQMKGYKWDEGLQSQMNGCKSEEGV
jgi:hypothetical protein